MWGRKKKNIYRLQKLIMAVHFIFGELKEKIYIDYNN